MSGERVNVIKDRAHAFLNLARELISRRLDLSSFNVHQACQLRIEASLLRLTGEMPRTHRIRELLGMLARRLEGLGFKEDALRIVDFVRERNGVLVDVESAYTESRYGVGGIAGSVVEMLRMAEELFKLLDEVEGHVLG